MRKEDKMARTANDGLQYFPFSVHFFSETDIMIIRSRYGSDGIIMYQHLLCEIYKNGYYLPIDDDYIMIHSDLMHIKENLTRQLVNFLVHRGIFNQQLWDSDKVLTSEDIQRQYQKSKKGSKRNITVDRKLWLLKNFETESFIKVYPDEDNSEKNDDYSKKNNNNSENYCTKESKENKNKLNESKTKEIPNFELYNKILYLYNYICIDLPECQLSSGRIAAIQSLMHQTFNNRAITLSDIAQCFNLVQRSEFLKGRIKDFSADFDWIIRYENFVKIMEQKYSKLSDESYDVSDFDKYAVNYIPPVRQQLPAFCKCCEHKNPYECIINCGNKAWAKLNDKH